VSVKIITFGCRLNIYESEVIKTFLQDSKKFDDKDIIIFNSCTVTSEAEKQLRQAIRKARKENPKSIIGVVGCAAQTNGKFYEKMEEADFVFGNIDKMKENNYELLLPIIEKIEKESKCKCSGNRGCSGSCKCGVNSKEEEHSCSYGHSHSHADSEHKCSCGHVHSSEDCECGHEHDHVDCDCEEDDYDEDEEIIENHNSIIRPLDFDNEEANDKLILVSNILELTELAPQLITGFEEKTRGFIQIQSGCDNHCTFCATRLARGKSISIPSDRIIEQINRLVENGYNEIVLTGIDITDYGKRLDEDINLGKLIKKILKETDLPRLRLSSLDVADLNDDLKEVLFNEDRVMPHIHISLQSGDNTILKRMARRHTREQVIDFCGEIRKYRSNMAIGADLIAGFPTETEAMHKNSYNLIEEISLTFGHIFPYSVRENTPAALMEQVPMETRRRRAKELRAITQIQLEDFTRLQSKIAHQVLIENEEVGRTENYLTVKLPRDILKNHKIGDVVELEFKYN